MKIEPIKAIIFDCDGTLVDSEYAHYLSWQYALQQEGHDFMIKDYYPLIGKSIEENAKLLAKRVGSLQPEKIGENKSKQFESIQEKGLPPIHSTVAFVHRLAKTKREETLKLGVASASKKKTILSHLKDLKIDHFFDIIVSGQDDLQDYHDKDGVNKPKPYIYLHTAKELGLSPNQCLVIEDSYSGVKAGVDAGCITIAVPNRYTQYQDLSQAHFKIDSFEGIDYKDILDLAVSRKFQL